MKGRNATLIEKRDEKLILRYYYWREVQRRRADDVIEILSADEFFLDTITIRRLIRKNLDRYLQLKQQKPNIKKLQFYNWSTNEITPVALSPQSELFG